MFAQGSLKSRIASHALLPSFPNRSRTDSLSFGVVEDPLRHHEMLQSVTLRRLPAATLHGRWQPHLALIGRAEQGQVQPLFRPLFSQIVCE